MRSFIVEYSNAHSQTFTARVELPLNQQAHNFVLFAHCFMVEENIESIRTISHYLTRAGFGVMRVDMTGNGENELELPTQTPDLEAAIDYLKQHYKLPTILVGHSIGGTKLLQMANQTTAKAICAISLNTDANLSLEALNLPSLIFHAEQDQKYPIDEVIKLFEKAPHPKSLLTLANGSHYINSIEDARYIGEILAAWALRYVKTPEEKPLKTDHQVAARLGNDGYTTEIRVGKHGFLADEPIEAGGKNFGPNPYELVSSGLAACTAMTLKMYANLKKWDLIGVEVHISHGKKHCLDCEDLGNKNQKIDEFVREIKLEGNLDEKQRERLLEIANRCPVHRTLHSEVNVVSMLI